MSTVLEMPQMKSGDAPKDADRRAIFYAFEDCRHAVFFDVEWEVLEEIMEKYEGIRNPRIFYKKGILEIMPISPAHDIPERIVDLIIAEFCDSIELDYENFGSSTQKRKVTKGAFEPDSSFYFGENAEMMRGRERILDSDPLPDLVFESDITHSSIYRDDLLAELGIAEIWRYKKKRVKILILENEEYIESESSRIFDGLTANTLTDFIEESRRTNRHGWRKSVRDWARENLRK